MGRRTGSMTGLRVACTIALLAAGFGVARAVTERSSTSILIAALIGAVALLVCSLAALSAMSRVRGSHDRRAAMAAAGVEWIGDVRMSSEALERALGRPCPDPPYAVGLADADHGVEVWIDATGRAGLLPPGHSEVASSAAVVVTDDQNAVTLHSARGPIVMTLVGPLWGLLPSTSARAVTIALTLNLRI